jgi:hypothetical protein
MVPFLEGQNLFGYVDGTLPQPPKLIPDNTSGLLVTNPAYLPWYHQDQMIFSAIISTLSVETLPHVIGLSTSFGSPWRLSLLLNLNLEFYNSSSSSPT